MSPDHPRSRARPAGQEGRCKPGAVERRGSRDPEERSREGDGWPEWPWTVPPAHELSTLPVFLYGDLKAHAPEQASPDLQIPAIPRAAGKYARAEAEQAALQQRYPTFR